MDIFRYIGGIGFDVRFVFCMVADVFVRKYSVYVLSGLFFCLTTLSVYAWDTPQCRNYNGSSDPEQPSTTIYVGDTGTFGCDSWGKVNDKWGKHRVAIKTASDIHNGSFGSWSAYDDVNHNQETSPVFTSSGTWYWGIQVEYTDAGGMQKWYCRNDSSWYNMWDTPTSDLTITVSVLGNPTVSSVTTNSSDPETEIKLEWGKWNSKNVMVVRGTNSTFFTPAGGTSYGVDYTSNDDIVIYNSGGTSCTDTGLTIGVKYYYKLYSENNSYYSSGVVTNYTIMLPEMAVSGNSNEIMDGDSSPASSDHTDFGSALLAGGTVVRTFTVENSGNVTLNLTGGTPAVVIGGTHSADFSLSSAPGVTNIAAGGSTTFAVTFDPSAAGTRSATLSIANNDESENPYNFSIQGVGVVPEIGLLGSGEVISDGDLSPTAADGTYFGSAALGLDSVTHTFVITNSGDGLLSLSGSPRVAISGDASDFSVQSQPEASVAAGCSESFSIRFSASAYGVRTGTVSIASTDTDENPYTFRIRGSGYKAAFIDDFGVAKSAPLCIDIDDDGVADSWELEYFGNTSGSASGDDDGDGWSNRDEFLAGTNPTNSDSYLHIASGGLVGDTSTNIQLTILSGLYSGSADFIEAGDAIGRVYRIYAADGSVTNAKVLLATVADDGSGTNVWVDSGATEEVRRRYYEVEAVYAGGACTNTEEWALYVEPRTTNRVYYLCVPVNYGSTAANNLNSRLGEHLATGLNSSDDPDEADKIRFINATGGWDEYYLSEAVGWTTNGTVAADVTVPPGRAMQIVCGSNSGVRANSVMVGRSFAESDMVDTAFKTSDGGWTLFGWPLANTRSAVASDTSADQLGFSSKGTGGTTWETNSSAHGDQLWIPDSDGSGWDWYWLTDNGGSTNINHRWYSTAEHGFGNITLKPGEAYYYYHTTNSGGAEFNWRPAVP